MKKIMTLVVGLVVVLGSLTSCHKDSGSIKTTSTGYVKINGTPVEKVKFTDEGHSFIMYVFGTNTGNTIVHDPNCSCNH